MSWYVLKALVFVTRLSIMSRILTGLRAEVQLGTKWAIKPTPAGVLVPMLKKHPTTFDSAPVLHGRFESQFF